MKTTHFILLSLIFMGFFLSCKLPGKIFLRNKPSIEDHKHFSQKKLLGQASDCDAQLIKEENIDLPDLSSWVFGKEMPTGSDLDQFFEKTNTTVFIVVRNDTILYEKYYNGKTEEDRSIVFSLSKSLVTTLVDIAIQEGHIESIDQKVSDFIPSFNEGKKKEISLKNLLDMTSGLNQDDYRKILLTAKTYYHYDLPKLIDKTPVEDDPGSTFIYKSLDTQVLGQCIEKATGMHIIDYIQAKIWNRLGMCGDAIVTLDRDEGNARVFGGMALGPKEILRFGKLFLNNGVFNGERIITEDWMNSIKKRNKKSKWWGYKFGWWRDGYVESSIFEDNDYYAAGYHGQFLYIDEDNNTMLLRLGKNWGGIWWQSSLGVLSRMLNDVPVVNLVEDNKAIGSYKAADGEVIHVDKKDRRKKKWELIRDGKKMKLSTFGARSVENFPKRTRLVFDANAEKEVIGLELDKVGEGVKYFTKIE